MTHRLTVVVHGTPAPQGSKNAFVNPRTGRAQVVESSKKVRPWRNAVAVAALEAAGTAQLPLWGRDEPLAVRLTFYLARPRSHYGSGKNADKLLPSAPAYPVVKPDIDKLERSTLDGLGDAGVWHDDSRVVRVTKVKLYGDRPGCHITVHGPGWAEP